MDNKHIVHVNKPPRHLRPLNLLNPNNSKKKKRKEIKNIVHCIHAPHASTKTTLWVQCIQPAMAQNERGEECAQAKEVRRGQACKCLQKRASEWGRTEKERKKEKEKKMHCQTPPAAWATSGAFTPADTSSGALKMPRVSKYWEDIPVSCACRSNISPLRVCVFNVTPIQTTHWAHHALSFQSLSELGSPLRMCYGFTLGQCWFTEGLFYENGSDAAGLEKIPKCPEEVGIFQILIVSNGYTQIKLTKKWRTNKKPDKKWKMKRDNKNNAYQYSFFFFFFHFVAFSQGSLLRPPYTK